MSRTIERTAGVLVVALLQSVVVASFAEERSPMKERVARIKKSIVRVVAGDSRGTGFVVSAEGLVATCSHVVREIEKAADGKMIAKERPGITVQLPDGRTVPATVHPSSRSNASVNLDFALLDIKEKGLAPLRLGKFAEADEGAEVYIAGFPLGIEQAVVARGMLSTKWKAGGQIDVAWLDIGMNKGNSGGPVVLLGNAPDDDRVVGIATFNLNPFAAPAEELKRQAETFPAGGIAVAGIDMPAFGRLVGQALATNSLKVGGCVSIEYLKQSLPK